jgi:osmotically-inducible protein OsmY
MTIRKTEGIRKRSRPSGSLPGRKALIGSFLAVTFAVAAPAAAITPASLNDRTIADKVEDEFGYDQAVDAGALEVTSREGIVTLDGVTHNVLEKERATRIARSVKGVRSVVNNIVVRPLASKTAGRLTQDVSLALAADPATDVYEVTAVADEAGRVVLTGTVDSWQERELAGTVVKSVSGVTDVENRLDVDYGAVDRPDPEIRADIEQRLRWDALVDSQLIEVAVEDGQVFLKGSVGSASERYRVRNLAYVGGVTVVDAEGLTVQDWLREPNRRDPEYVTMSEAETVRAVNDALLYDPRVELQNVQVEASEGTVTLRGKVDSVAAKRSAEQDARNTLGVRRVVNRIKVESMGEDSDAELQETIRARLVQDPYIGAYDISVVINGGIAKLYGTVDTFFEKSRADYVAERVNGVIGVNNNLTVRNDHIVLTYDPYVSIYPVYLYEWYDYRPTVSHRSDAAIRQDIINEFWWTPFISPRDVDVSVENGIAVLGGRVDDLWEWQTATENAWEGGALAVVNNIRIAGGET